MQLQQKEDKKIKACSKSVQKEPTGKIYLLTVDLKPLGPYIKGKHSTGREIQGSSVVDSFVLVAYASLEASRTLF